MTDKLRRAGYGDIVFLWYRTKHPKDIRPCRVQIALKDDNVTVKDILFQ